MTWTLVGNIATQSATDTNLSGLAGIAGVTTQVVGVRTVYRVATLQIAITGSLTYDARSEYIEMTMAIVSPVFATNGTGSLTINSVLNGKATYEDALIIRPQSNAVQTEIRINTGTTFILNGARITVSGIGSNNYQTIFCDKGATITITNGWIRSSTNQVRWGENGSGNMSAFNISGLIAEKIYTTIFGVFGSLNGLAPLSSVTQLVSYGSFTFLTLRDYAPLDSGSFLDNYDIPQLFVDNSLGSGLDFKAGQGPGKWITLRKEFTLSTLTPAGAVINGAVAYIRDTNNGARTAVTNIAGQLSDNVYIQPTSGAGITPTISLYVMHGQAQAPYQSALVKDYRTKTTVAGADLFDVNIWAYGYNYALMNDVAMKGNGVLALMSILIADTNTTLSESAAVAKLASSITVAGNNLTLTASSTLDDVYDAMKAYKTRVVQAQLEYPSISTQPVSEVNQVLTTAMSVILGAIPLLLGTKFKTMNAASVSSQFTAGGAYTYVAGTMTAPASAPTFTGGTANIGAAATFAFSSAGAIVSMTPTAASTYIFTGAHTGTLTLRNAAAFAITVQVPAGTTTSTVGNTGGAITVINPAQTLQILRPNIINGSNFVILNTTQLIEVASGTTSGGGGINVTLTKDTHYNAADALEVRIGYCVTLAAKLAIVELLTAPTLTTVNSAPTAQADHTVYNAIAINGSAVTGFTADYVNDDVNVTLGADFLGQNFMAWWVYNESTLGGLRDFVGLYTLIDEGNMRNNTALALILLDNTTTTDIKQIDNARIFRSDAGYPVKSPSSGGGAIDINWRSPVLVTGLGTIAQDTRIEMDANSTKFIAIKAKTDLIPAIPASSTNITAGTITTVTNLTNAPTAGDLTATMKASVTAAVPTVVQMRTEMDTNSSKLDVATSTRLATAGYTVPPTVVAIRNEIDANSTKLTVPTSSLETTANANANAAAAPALVFASISENSQSYGKQIRDMRATLLGKTAGGGTTTETFLAADNATARVVSTNNGTDRTNVSVPGA